MSTHINAANKNDIAESILLPGDPLRAKFIAENFLDSPKCYNEIRGMLGLSLIHIYWLWPENSGTAPGSFSAPLQTVKNLPTTTRQTAVSSQTAP